MATNREVHMLTLAAIIDRAGDISSALKDVKQDSCLQLGLIPSFAADITTLEPFFRGAGGDEGPVTNEEFDPVLSEQLRQILLEKFKESYWDWEQWHLSDLARALGIEERFLDEEPWASERARFTAEYEAENKND